MAMALVVLPCASAPAAEGPATAAQDCARGGLVDGAFRDAALALLQQLAIDAPAHAAHGAIRSNLAAGHVDKSGGHWHFVSAYQVNLALAEALRLAPTLAPLAARWLRWQARHATPLGPGQRIVFDHWVRTSDLHVAPCLPDGALARCPDVDAYDSTAASLLIMADAYLAQNGAAALLREEAVRAALQGAAGAMAALTLPDGLSSAKPGHPVEYLMDAAEVAAGWRAWARVQALAYGDSQAAQGSLQAARRTEAAMRERLWHAPSRSWRVSQQAGAPDFSRWYPDTMAQAWPLLWGVQAADAADTAMAWRQAASRWQGPDGWAVRNVDPDGFWWPAAAVAAHCAGDGPLAREWMARARTVWLAPEQPFAWPFQVGDLRWLFWLSDPLPAAPARQLAPRTVP